MLLQRVFMSTRFVTDSVGQTTRLCSGVKFARPRSRFSGCAALANDYCGGRLRGGLPVLNVLPELPPPLASLFGFRSRTLVFALSFFSSLIITFLFSFCFGL